MKFDVESISNFTFSRLSSPSLSSSVVFLHDRSTLLINIFMTSVKAVSQTSLPSICAHKCADMPFSHAFTF